MISSAWSKNDSGYRVAAGSLLVVVDEDVVPRDGSHVEGVERAEHPQEGRGQQGEQEYVQSFPAMQVSGDITAWIHVWSKQPGMGMGMDNQLRLNACMLAPAPPRGRLPSSFKAFKLFSIYILI